jgi:hypothetical protein
MKRNLHKFVLSSEEMLQLRKAVSEDESLLAAIHLSEAEIGASVILELELETTEKLRGCLTELLAKSGFDKDYSLTESGAILEGLIDKFYIG